MKNLLLRKTDQIAGPMACRICAWTGRPDTALPYTAPIDPQSIRRILVVRPGGIGDMVMLLPLLRTLSAQIPAGELTVVCESRNRCVLDLADIPLRTLCYDTRPWATVCTLRAQRFDAAIDTEQFHHFSAVFAYLSRAPIRIGFNINPQRNGLYTHLVAYRPDGHEEDQFAALLRPLALATPPPPLTGILRSRPVDPLPAPVREALGERYAVIHPATAHPYKQWPVARYVAVGRELCARGLGIAVSGGAADGRVTAAVATALAAAGCRRVRNVAGQLPFVQAAALIRQAALYVGADTGIAHLAAAFDTPSVVLFGPSDGRKWGHAAAPRHHAVSADLPCAPCFIFGYHKPCRLRECMQRITAEQVLHACAAALD